MPISQKSPAVAAVLAALVMALAAPPVMAQPDHAKGGKHGEKAERKAEKEERKHGKDGRDAHPDLQPGAYFSDRHREGVHTYYSQHYGGGKACPPGLAKKNNGCMPPGQAKKWSVGQPLPPTVTVYPVPRQVMVYLPPQPPGYKYVQVAGDILLIAVGTQMVVDGISGLLGR